MGQFTEWTPLRREKRLGKSKLAFRIHKGFLEFSNRNSPIKSCKGESISPGSPEEQNW